MRIVTILALVAGTAQLESTGASAQVLTDYPFCAYGGKTSEGVSCDFATLAQCQAATAGAGGSCVAIPRAGQAGRRAAGTGAATKR